jgi:hypothetical protein
MGGGLSQGLLQVSELCRCHESVGCLATLPVAIKGSLDVSIDGDDTTRPCHLQDQVCVMWHRHKLGKCQASQESVVRCLEISDLKLNVFCVDIFPSPESHWKSDLTNRCHWYARDYAMERCPIGRSRALDNPIWSKVFKNRIFRELSTSTRTQLSLISLTMGLTMIGYHPSFGTKLGWSLWSKVMGTSDHLRYSGVAGETAMTSRVVSLCFLLDSYDSGPP